MATIYRCDKCHREYPDRETIATITYPVADPITRVVENMPFRTIDLCSYCLERMHEHLRADVKVSTR
jgi:hypothetical protein